MSLESLLYDSSRLTADITVKFIEENPEQLKPILELSGKPYPVSMRAARVVELYCEKHHEAISPFITMLTDELLKTKVDGVKRGFLKVLRSYPKVTSIKNAVLIFDRCLIWLYSEKETISVRVYCIDILIKFAIEEPELKNEIRLAIENLPESDSPGIRVTCRKALLKLK